VINEACCSEVCGHVTSLNIVSCSSSCLVFVIHSFSALIMLVGQQGQVACKNYSSCKRFSFSDTA